MSAQFDQQIINTQSFFIKKGFEIDSQERFPRTSYLTKLLYFTEMVKTNALFDLKNRGYSQADIRRQSLYHGQVFLFDDYGNYNYGVAARAFGITLNDAIFGAGLNQMSKWDGYWNPSGWFDDPRDTQMIINGYNAKVK